MDSFYSNATLVTTDLEAIRTDNTQDDSSYFAEHGGSKVLSFDGTAYGIVANSTALFNVGADDFTISGKILNFGAVGHSQYFLAKYETTPASKRQWAVRINEVGDLVLAGSGNGSSVGRSEVDSDDVPSGWFEFSVTKTRIYASWTINGSPVSDTSPLSLPSTVFSSDAPINIGCNGGDTPAAGFMYEGDIAWLEMTSGGVTCRWDSRNAYGTTLPDSIGTNDATLVNTEFVYIPALLDGADDVAGLGITNPGGVVHNGGPYSISNSVMGAVTYADLITNAVYNATVNTNGGVAEIYLEN